MNFLVGFQLITEKFFWQIFPYIPISIYTSVLLYVDPVAYDSVVSLLVAFFSFLPSSIDILELLPYLDTTTSRAATNIITHIKNAIISCLFSYVDKEEGL